MLGSVHDAEDALQEALLRAWRGLPRFEGRSSLRSWLYRSPPTPASTLIAQRPKRVLPIDYGPAADPHDGPGEPLVESVWVEPYPDETLGLEDGFAAPEARYEQRESVELAFIAALQHLPANQRAVLILREVLGFSAKEVAETLETTRRVGEQRAAARPQDGRRARCPSRASRRRCARSATSGVREVVEGYVDAWERGDVDAVVAMLAEDAAFVDAAARELVSAAASADRDFLGRRAALGRVALASRPRRAPTASRRSPSTAGTRRRRPTSRSRSTCSPFAAGRSATSPRSSRGRRSPATPRPTARWPEQPIVPERFVDVFERFGLPDRLD